MYNLRILADVTQTENARIPKLPRKLPLNEIEAKRMWMEMCAEELFTWAVVFGFAENHNNLHNNFALRYLSLLLLVEMLRFRMQNLIFLHPFTLSSSAYIQTRQLKRIVKGC